MADVIIHRDPWFDDYHDIPPSYEYPLPASGMPKEHQDTVGPWLRRFIGLDEANRHALLEARWESELNGPLAPVLRWYLEYEPVSLVVHRNAAWLLCSKRATDQRERTLFLIPESSDVNNLRSRLHEHGFHDELLLRLAVTLGGLREDFPPNAGDFMGDHDEFSMDERGGLRLLNEPWQAENVEGFNEWENSLFLYAARNGDSVIVHPSGKVGWWKFGERRIEEYAVDISDFADKYARYLRESWVKTDYCDQLVHWPFDSYGPDQ